MPGHNNAFCPKLGVMYEPNAHTQLFANEDYRRGRARNFEDILAALYRPHLSYLMNKNESAGAFPVRTLMVCFTIWPIATEVMPLRESPERGSADYLERLTSKSNVRAVAVDLLKPYRCSMTIRCINDHDIDEALWTAYRHYDKSAVTETLLRRYLPALTFIPNVGAARNAVRESGRPKFLKTGSAYK